MPKRVLVIDGDPDLRRIVARVLQQEGYEVEAMESGLQLYTSIRDFAPDLILADSRVVGPDGLSLCRALQQHPDTLSIPVILVSTDVFPIGSHATMGGEATAYLTKPIEPDILAQTVRDTLTQEATIKIWGCRGSIPAPEKARGLYGGNTSCVELILPRNRHLIFDAGTGIRVLGNTVVRQSPIRAGLFLTHFHWDHIQGFPFFKPLYQPGNEIQIYGPSDSDAALADTLGGQMAGVFFPVSIDAFRSTLKFIALQEETVEAFGVRVRSQCVLHPGRTLAYRVEINGHSLVYAPDHEILPECVDPVLSGDALRFAEFARGATLLIHDCTYSRQVYEGRRGWGHSCGESLAALAAHAGVERVLLFHHDPDNADEGVEAIHREFQEAAAARGADILSEPAREGGTYSL
jgi:phosphoribosyl 1,2-cyclic phosphodiesterase/CheY-like chemotaxis protein